MSAIPRAPPSQQAATPMPPCANPGLRTYASTPPTGTAGTPVNRTSGVSLPAMPIACQVPGTGAYPGTSVERANSRRPSSVSAVTSACVQLWAPEQYGSPRPGASGRPRRAAR